MQAVSAPTSKRAARLLETVGAAGADPRRFAQLGVIELPRVLASELTTLSVCDLRNGRRRVVGNPDHALSADDIAPSTDTSSSTRWCASTRRIMTAARIAFPTR